jgi:predicted helicase
MPLYLHDGGNDRGTASFNFSGSKDDGPRENIDSEFRALINSEYDQTFSPELIFGYVYSILHAPTYQETYAEFLRIDFPRIPLCEKAADFRELAEQGWELVRAHLLHDIPERGLGALEGRGDNVVGTVRYESEKHRLWINESQYLAPIPPEVWAFHIGGYQVLAKYLKDRKGRALALDEMTNLENIANVLAFTLDRMEEIDEIYRRAFETPAA